MKMQWKCLALIVLMAATNPVWSTENFDVDKKLQFMMFDKVALTTIMPFMSSVTDYNKMRTNPLPWLKQNEQKKVIEYLQKNNIKELPEIEFDVQELRFKLGQYNVKASVADYYAERFEINGQLVELKGKSLEQKMQALDAALAKVASTGQNSFSLIASAHADDAATLKQNLLMGMVVLNIGSVSKNAEIKDGLNAALANIDGMNRACNGSPADLAKVDSLWAKIKAISANPNEFKSVIQEKFKDKGLVITDGDISKLKGFNFMISVNDSTCKAGLEKMIAEYKIANPGSEYVGNICKSFISLNSCINRLLSEKKLSDARRSDRKETVAAEDTTVKQQGGAVKAQ